MALRSYLSMCCTAYNIDCASFSTSSTGNSSPFFSLIHSRIPPHIDAITGNPHARASNTATEKFSLRDGRRKIELFFKMSMHFSMKSA